MCRVVELLKDAGLPDGVVNMVHGTAESMPWVYAHSTIAYVLCCVAVNALCDHPLVQAVTFVGTSKYA
jgi:acyl-CoA reductase-like NAD-dependent aldehyde dehydrogenase